jgi:hypothetical protein
MKREAIKLPSMETETTFRQDKINLAYAKETIESSKNKVYNYMDSCRNNRVSYKRQLVYVARPIPQPYAVHDTIVVHRKEVVSICTDRAYQVKQERDTVINYKLKNK